MYKFVKSYLKKKSSNEPYGNVDIQEILLKDLLGNYIDGWIELSNPALTKNVFLTLDRLRRDNVPIRLDLTFNRFLGFLGNLSLDTVNTAPTYSSGMVQARDAIQAGWKVNMCEPFQPASTGAAVGAKKNLIVTRDFGDVKKLHNLCLTTVNGFVHRNIPRKEGVEIIDGGATWLHSRENLCGLISFESVGKVMQIPLVEEMIHRPTPATPYADSVIIDLEVNLEGKSVILVLGGYLYIQPSFLKIVAADNGTIKVDLKSLDLPTCFMNSYDTIDLEHLGFLRSELQATSGGINVSKARSDVAVMGWLTLSQSFVVVVDVPVLTVQTRTLHKTGVYGSYEYHENPWLPLQDHYGRISEYWVKQQGRTWIIQMLNPTYAARMDYYAVTEGNTIMNKTIPYNAEWTREPRFLEIIGTRPDRML